MNTLLAAHQMTLIYYKFWYKKEKFWLYEDTYDEWSFIGVEEGSFEYEIAGNKGVATFGDLVICPPQVPFRRIVISPLSFHHYKVLLPQISKTAIDSQNLPHGKISIANYKRLKSNYELLKLIGNDWKGKGAQAACSHYLCDSLYLYYLEQEEHCSQQSLEVEDEIMAHAMLLLRQQAFRPFKLETLAAEFGMSQSLFTKRFKQIYRTTPSNYLSALRLDKAKSLLLETNLSLDEIAECCGYQNGYYLNRVFTRRMGVSPGRYRKRHRM